MNKQSKLTKYQQPNRIPIISKTFNSLNSSKTSTVSRGFTIIELLIVIVIIGILVAITAVAYNGVTRQATEAALKSELKQANNEVELIKAKTGAFPTSASSLTTSKRGVLIITTNISDDTYCLAIVPNSDNQNVSSFNITNSSGVAQGRCPSPAIQTIIKTSCPVIRTQVKDQRDNNSYYIQKLADGNCWMTTNLAYAGGVSNGGTNQYNDVIPVGNGSTGTIANGTSDSAVTYTSAKYYIPGGANPSIDPISPVLSNNGTGQYGYLYNYCAAMGSQGTSACAAATTPSVNPNTNICPAGWRLPTGTVYTGEFISLNNSENGGKTNTDTGLITGYGSFQYGGLWNNNFLGQGNGGNYWSSTPNAANYAQYLHINKNTVLPDYNNAKYTGYSIRCIAE